MIAYVIAQCLGAITGSLILDLLLAGDEPPGPITITPVSLTYPTFSTTSTSTTTTNTAYGTSIIYVYPTSTSPTPNPNPIVPVHGTTFTQGFLAEFIAAFMLLLAICGTHQGAFPGTNPLVPTAVLFAATAGHLFAVSLSLDRGINLLPAEKHQTFFLTLSCEIFMKTSENTQSY